MNSLAVNGGFRTRFNRRGAVDSNTIPYLFHELWVARATGVLSVSDREVRKSVEFKDGMVMFASSSDRDDRFNQILLKAGVISLKSMMRGLEVSLATRDRLGEVLVRGRLLSQAEVEKWLRAHVRSIVYSLFDWVHGQFVFEELPVQADAASLRVSGDAMVVEGMRVITSWTRIYEEVGGLNSEFLAARGMPEIAKGLPLLPDQKKLLEMCRVPMTLGELCEQSGLIDYEVCKSIWAFLIVGALMKS